MARDLLRRCAWSPKQSVELLKAARWLPEAGWRFVEHQPLGGPVSLVIAEAV